MKFLYRKKTMLFAVIISIISFHFFTYQIGLANKETITNQFEPSSIHDLRIYEFSHYNKPIYANYSTVNIIMLYQSPEVNSSVISAHYSVNGINWTTVVFTKNESFSNNRAFFNGTLGPFLKSGEYQLKINATEFSTEYASVFYRFDVLKIRGIIFIDLSYNVRDQSDQTQYIDIDINVLGDDIKLGSIYVSSNQQEEDEDPYKLNLKEDTNHTYWTTIGPTNTWDKVIRVTFFANTSDNTKYVNSNFIIIKETVFVPENFWRGKFPAIIFGVIIMGALTTVFIMNRRRAPKKFDV